MSPARPEPIAICGMACRLPGDTDTPEALWRLLEEGRHVATDLPADRGWDLNALYDPAPDAEGKTYVRKGGFLGDVAGFDPGFFGIPPREAEAMDPQQRLVLETAWEACEHARLDPATLRGSSTGVYVGAYDSRYPDAGDLGAGNVYGGLGLAISIIAGRIAYVMGLHGPALVVDTSCSSALTALHLAVQALRAGECESAIAAGVSVIAGPRFLIDFSTIRALASDGRCKAFDESADGFCPSEGAVALLLMPLSRARATGRPVLAVIRGTALNEDGTGTGFTVPNGAAQEKAIGLALADAGLAPADVDLVEAHGTGTPVGDPIEAGSLISAYGAHRPASSPLWIGSLKSNIGHTQAVAGLAGVAKVVLALRNETMPRTLHIERPNPAVDWSSGTVRPLVEPRPWRTNGRPRRAGVLAYGISGTNTHIIVEEAPPSDASAGQDDAPGGVTGPARVWLGAPPAVWTVSGKSPEAVAAQAARLGEHVRARPDLKAGDVGWSLLATRTAFEHRAAVVAGDRDALLDGLDRLARGETGPDVLTGTVPARGTDPDTDPAAADPAGDATDATDAPGGGTQDDGVPATAPSVRPAGPVLVFPGQGAQWAGMAAGLMDSSPVFAAAMERCAKALQPWIGFDLLETVRDAGAPGFERAEVVQPALFAMYVSLAELWRAHGVTPAAVIGHSQGEIAAAYVAGALSLADAARVVALRSRALAPLAGRGAMASVGLGAEDAAKLAEPWQGRIEVAVVNGPAATVLAGPADDVRELLELCEQRGVWAQRVPVDYASHCAQIEPARDRILADLDGVEPLPPLVPMYSTLTGGPLEDRPLDAAYWYDGLRNPVRFAAAAEAALADGHRLFIEVSPHPVLAAPLTDVLSAADTGDAGTAVVATLRREEGGPDRFAAALAQAHLGGAAVDFGPLFPGAREVDLPTYAFQRRRFWPKPYRGTAGTAAGGQRASSHPMLGAEIELPDGGLMLTGRLVLSQFPWLVDHTVHDAVLFPGLGMIELLTHAGDRVGCDTLENVSIHAFLTLPADQPVELQIAVSSADPQGSRDVVLRSRPHNAPPGQPWTEHADAVLSDSATLAAAGAAVHPPVAEQQQGPWPPEGAEPIPLDGFYDHLLERGHGFGPTYQNLTAAWRRGDTLYGEVSLRASVDEQDASGIDPEGYIVHPTLLDSAMHPLLSGLTHDGGMAPRAIASVRMLASGATSMRTTLTPTGPNQVTAALHDTAGRPVAVVTDLRGMLVSHQEIRDALRGPDLGYRLDWKPVSLPETAPGGGEGDGLGGHPTPAEARAAVAGGAAAPPVIVLDQRSEPSTDVAAEPVHRRTEHLLGVLQDFLADPALAESRLAVITRGAQVTGEDPTLDRVGDLPGAALWGLVRASQLEYPGRLQLIDLDGRSGAAPPATLPAALASTEPQLALREGRALVPRLVAAATSEILTLPDGLEPWRLQATGGDDAVQLVPAPELRRPLDPGQVRVRVEAAGLGRPDGAGGSLGFEVAGVVDEVAPDITDLIPGERVMVAQAPGAGDEPDGLASLLSTERRLVLPVPPAWTPEQAAASPAAYLSAHDGLVRLAGVRAGSRVLVDVAAGIGLATVQLARALGAQVYALAEPADLDPLIEAGVPAGHVITSRGPDLEDLARAAGAIGLDAVLGRLTGEPFDAAQRLLAAGGRYVHLGTADGDGQDADAVHPSGGFSGGFDSAPPAELTALLRHGEPVPPQVTALDVRYARHALRLAAREPGGRVVLSLPRSLDPDGTVLITGGTGVLGTLLARHLVTAHGVRRLLLVSRRGPDAPGAADLAEELSGLGADVTIASCDSVDRVALAELLDGIPAEHPLTAVVHASGVLDDAALPNLTPRHLENVLRSKVDIAVNLHELTKDLPLAAFVLYSSLGGLIGNQGQANYNAANNYLDALAYHRRGEGLPAVSIPWGLWDQTSDMSATFSAAKRIRTGLRPMSTADALAALDLVLRRGQPLVVVTGVGDPAQATEAPDMLTGVLGRYARQQAHNADDAETLRHLGTLPAPERVRELLLQIRANAAAVLGYPDHGTIPADRPLREAGLDSLSVTQLRTRLTKLTGLRLPATVLMDHPVPRDLAEHLSELMEPGEPRTPTIPAPRSGEDADAAATADTGGASLARLCSRAWSAGDEDEARRLVADAVRHRPVFTAAPEARGKEPVPLARGTASPGVICLPSFIAGADAGQYEHIAARFDAERDVHVLLLPGYQDGELLPASREALLDALAQDVQECAGGRPYVLLGHSSGGALAHSLARYIQARPGTEHHTAGVVLLDTVSSIDSAVVARYNLMGRLMDRELAGHSTPDSAFTAMTAYFELFDGWAPEPSPVPTLFARAAGNTDQLTWPLPHDRDSIPGDHFTILQEHAATTADAIRAWVAGVPRDRDGAVRPQLAPLD
ncbi:acyltransferase domain-containing protein [Actinomadura rugatobispora]|uniref:Acyltransferase domain-containing protein n=1 Tax=Actinomadura rugatobispora TaxID=1994 RepID=A0ABW0ZQU1_9ACTN|nr:hypothetical protein GCM10010200_037080 [Actinomadura rugatobispora]